MGDPVVPYESERQRLYMHANKPNVAKKYAKEGKAYVKKKAVPKKGGKK